MYKVYVFSQITKSWGLVKEYKTLHQAIDAVVCWIGTVAALRGNKLKYMIEYKGVAYEI